MFVKSFVDDTDGITTPSTARTPAEERDSVVSVACQSSIDEAENTCEIEPAREANVATPQSYTALADRYSVLDAVFPLIVVALLATFSGTYAILVFKMFQFAAVCHGVSTLAMIASPISTALPPSVPATEITNISHLTIAPAVQLPHVVGYVLPEAL